MGEKRERLKNFWFYGVIYLGVIGLWWLTSAAWFGFESLHSHYRFSMLMIIKSGLVTILFTGRFLLFPGNRSPRIFSWTLGSAILGLIATKIWINPVSSVGIVQLAELGDGLIWCFNAAWLVELIGAIFLKWSRIPIEALALAEIKRQFGTAFFKLGLFNALVVCFLELYWVNAFAVEMIPVGYFLFSLFLGAGMGLLGVFSFRMNRWYEERIQSVDGQLSGLLDWKTGDSRSSFIGLTPGEIERTQLLLLWRRYLEDIQTPAVAWWVWGSYLVFSGLIIGLGYWLKVVVEV